MRIDYCEDPSKCCEHLNFPTLNMPLRKPSNLLRKFKLAFHSVERSCLLQEKKINNFLPDLQNNSDKLLNQKRLYTNSQITC